MQSFIIYLYLKDTLHVSDGFSVHHQEIKTAHTASDLYCYLLFARLAAGSSNCLTNTWRCMCSFELLMMEGKTVWKM